MTTLTGRMRLFVVAVIVSAIGTILLIAPANPVHDWPRVVLLALLALVLASMAFELPLAASVSLGFAVTFAGIVYAGPVGGALVGAAGAISVQEIRERKPVLLMVGNAAQLVLSASAAGVVYVALGAVPLDSGLAMPQGLVPMVLAPLLAVTCFFGVNVLLVASGVALRTGMRLPATLRVLEPGSYWVSLVVLALLGYVLASLLSLGSWVGLLLLVLPFASARRTFRVYLEFSEAYTTTVRSLVAAIEAKDPYTRGHSERVAIYAQQIAAEAELRDSEVQLLERAALLHDVGKIGIHLETLTSPSRLTSEEFREIRTHPVLGSDLLESVEFLADVVPVIRHHHERIDGAGYPDGLVERDIPYLSKVLAVADSYDAMTSNRAYRPAMSPSQAQDEMLRVAGTQLDAVMVQHLIRALQSADVRGSDE